jgi:hypothetical protein
MGCLQLRRGAGFYTAATPGPAEAARPVPSDNHTRNEELVWFFCVRPHSESRGSLVMLQSAREQFTAPLEDWIGGRCQMSVDPLEVAHDVEQELAHLNVLCPTEARWSEIFFGRGELSGSATSRDMLGLTGS